jgi:hypothetical protein
MMGESRSHGDTSRRCHARQHDHYDAHLGSGAATEGVTVGRYGIQSGVLRAQSSSDENSSGEFDDVSSIVPLHYFAGCVFGMLWRDDLVTDLLTCLGCRAARYGAVIAARVADAAFGERWSGADRSWFAGSARGVASRQDER